MEKNKHTLNCLSFPFLLKQCTLSLLLVHINYVIFFTIHLVMNKTAFKSKCYALHLLYLTIVGFRQTSWESNGSNQMIFFFYIALGLAFLEGHFFSPLLELWLRILLLKRTLVIKIFKLTNAILHYSRTI